MTSSSTITLIPTLRLTCIITGVVCIESEEEVEVKGRKKAVLASEGKRKCKDQKGLGGKYPDKRTDEPKNTTKTRQDKRRR